MLSDPADGYNHQTSEKLLLTPRLLFQPGFKVKVIENVRTHRAWQFLNLSVKDVKLFPAHPKHRIFYSNRR
jgi:hypothetical protein